MKSSSAGRRSVRVLVLTLVALIAGFASLIRSAYRGPTTGDEISLGQAYRLAETGQIVEVTLLDEDARVTGARCVAPAAAVTPAPPSRCAGQVKAFHFSYPRSDVATQDLIERIREGGAEVVVDEQTGKAITKMVATFVFPLLLLANLFALIFVSRGGDSSIADIAGFGTIRRKRQRRRHTATAVTFADVAGAEEAVAELREVTDYLKDPKSFEAYGAAAPKGVLLFGPPGCGKTLLARAVAGESGVPFFSISGAEFVESLVGVGAARVRDLFRQVREEAPAIVFIDEIDAVGRRRGGEGQTGGEREQTVNQLLVELDGFEVTAGIVLMGATNRPDILDPALLRPGRFDRHVTLDPPNLHGRCAILLLHAAGRPMAPEVDFDSVAAQTPGFTGADLANVVNEAALLALRDGKGNSVRPSHLTEAIQRVRHGPRRRGHLMTVEERRRIAVHESGHAVVAAALGRASQLQRVSIVARGRGLGHSVVTDEGESVLLTGDEIEADLAIAMAGIAAEELSFGRSSTAAEDDIARATALAREMVGLYGMSDRLGRVRLLSRYDSYLGAEATVLEPASPDTMKTFDQEVRRLIAIAEGVAGGALRENRAQLDRMADALEAEETLEGEPLSALVRAVDPASVQPLAGPPRQSATNGAGAKTGPRSRTAREAR